MQATALLREKFEHNWAQCTIFHRNVLKYITCISVFQPVFQYGEEHLSGWHCIRLSGRKRVKYCGVATFLSTATAARYCCTLSALHPPPIAVQGATHVDLLQCTYWHKLWETQCTVRRGCSENTCTASNRQRTFFATAPLGNNAYIATVKEEFIRAKCFLPHN